MATIDPPTTSITPATGFPPPGPVYGSSSAGGGDLVYRHPPDAPLLTLDMDGFRRAVEAARGNPIVLPNEVRRDELADMAAELAPLIFDRLKAMLRDAAPAEARGMAQEARSAGPSLDALSCHALADWLAERGMEGLSGEVRSLPAQDGDVMILTWPTDAHGYAEGIRIAARDLREHFEAVGKRVAVIAMPDDCAARLLRAGKGA